LRQLFNSENGRDTIRRNLVTRKTLARLVEIATQDGANATPTAEQATTTPAQKPARKKKAANAALKEPETETEVEPPAETSEASGE
jgi:hypothetical protein